MCIIFHFCISLDFKLYVCSYFIFIFSHFLIVLITFIGYFVCVCVCEWKGCYKNVNSCFTLYLEVVSVYAGDAWHQ